MRSQQIPVVGAHYNDRVVEFAHSFEKVNHPPELGIYFANRREITRPRCTLVLLVELTPNALRPPIKPRPVRQIIIGIGRRRQLLLCIAVVEFAASDKRIVRLLKADESTPRIVALYHFL